jgi:hypothetical protein
MRLFKMILLAAVAVVFSTHAANTVVDWSFSTPNTLSVAPGDTGEFQYAAFHDLVKTVASGCTANQVGSLVVPFVMRC